MRRPLAKSALFLGLLCSGISFAQTATITGTIKDLATNVVTAGKITFTLKPGVDSTISGAARFLSQTVTCGISPAGAVVNWVNGAPGSSPCVITMNSALTPPGTYYQVNICGYYSCPPGAVFNFYAYLASQDISTLTPTPTTAPVYSFLNLGQINAFSYLANGHSLSSTDLADTSFIARLNVASMWSSQQSFPLAGLGQVSQMNEVFYVGDTMTQWAGADLGAQINSAYAALPSVGGEIHVIPNPTGGCYATSTTVNFDVNFKPVRFVGDGSSPVCIQYTGAGTGWSINWGSNHIPGVGVYNLKLVGNGLPVIGINIGNIRDTDMVEIVGNKIGDTGTGFVDGIKVENGSFNMLIEHNTFFNNTIAVDCTWCGELNRFAYNNFGANGTAIDSTLQGTTLLLGNSFDAQTGPALNFHGVGNRPRITSIGNNWENPSNGTAQYIVSTVTGAGPSLFSFGDFWLDDVGSGTQATMLDLTDFDTVSIKAAYLFSAGRTTTNWITVTNSPDVDLEVASTSSTLFPSYCTGCSAARSSIRELNPGGPSTSNWTLTSTLFNTNAQLAAQRLSLSPASNLVTGDFALSAGWGATTAVSALAGKDQAWRATITANGAGLAANPTITLTFHDGTMTNSPICSTKMQDSGTGVFSADILDAPTATTNVITYKTGVAPVAGNTYVFTSTCIGR